MISIDELARIVCELETDYANRKAVSDEYFNGYSRACQEILEKVKQLCGRS